MVHRKMAHKDTHSTNRWGPCWMTIKSEYGIQSLLMCMYVNDIVNGVNAVASLDMRIAVSELGDSDWGQEKTILPKR